jgi:hypothetical protein
LGDLTAFALPAVLANFQMSGVAAMLQIPRVCPEPAASHCDICRGFQEEVS